MKKIPFLSFLFLFSFCKKEEVNDQNIEIPACIQHKIDFWKIVDAKQYPTMNLYEYQSEYYFEQVFGTLDNGSATLYNVKCDSICVYSDDLSCSKLGDDFFVKRKFIKVVY